MSNPSSYTPTQEFKLPGFIRNMTRSEREFNVSRDKIYETYTKAIKILDTCLKDDKVFSKLECVRNKSVISDEKNKIFRGTQHYGLYILPQSVFPHEGKIRPSTHIVAALTNLLQKATRELGDNNFYIHGFVNTVYNSHIPKYENMKNEEYFIEFSLFESNYRDEDSDLIEYIGYESYTPAQEFKLPGFIRNMTRSEASGLFRSAYVGRFPIEYLDNRFSFGKEHAIAVIYENEARDARNYIKGINNFLNSKTNKFKFIYENGVVIAEEVHSIYGEPDDVNTRHLKSGDDKDPIHDTFNGTDPKKKDQMIINHSSKMDQTQEFYLHDLQRIPLVYHYVNDLGMAPEVAVNVLESFLVKNPFLNMYLIEESYFKTSEEYDNALFEAFVAAAEACDGKIDLYQDALHYSTERLWNPNELVYTQESVVRNRGLIDRAKHTVTQTLSPIARNIMNQVDAIIGDQAAKEEVLTGSKLLKVRRLFLKMIVAWKIPAIVTALHLIPGGWVGIVFKIILYIASFIGVVKNAKNTGSVLTGIGDGNDDPHNESQRLVLNELDLELKITREKIDDAKSRGDTKAKYDLMRIENRIEREIFRIKYGKTPSQSFVDNKG